ncbi:MAG TPA: CmpA/NrtA family ABC transporter substrate-binding protein [Steroidobacteraceae bacterium]|jgi:NitT/TauT family transport system ATP-binding protein
MSHTKLTIGFAPLLDCAPLIVAAANGFGTEQGLELALVRESSWANIRDRTIVGHFDAAHMLAPLPIASTLGIGHLKVPMIAPMALGLGGNAITVRCDLHDDMQNAGMTVDATPQAQGEALRRVIAERRQQGKPTLMLAMVYPFSAHNYELRYWLAACGIDPDRDVQLIVIPPPLLVDAMRAGQIDGFCVGEPWNSVAVESGVGRILMATTAIWRNSPEKVLGVTASWAQQHPEQLSALIRALWKSAAWCEQPGNHADLAALLSEPRHIGTAFEVLHRTLSGRLRLTSQAEPVAVTDFYIPARYCATFPWKNHAQWFYDQMVRWRQAARSNDDAMAACDTYRPDLYRAALAPLDVDVPSGDSKLEERADEPSNVPSRQGQLRIGPQGFFNIR